MHDHLVHFYHLHALDFVDVVSATKADPANTAEEAVKWAKIAGHKPYISAEADFRAVQERIIKFINKGDLEFLEMGIGEILTIN